MATLKHIFRDLLTLARRHEGQPHRCYLKGGLTVTVTQERAGDVVLVLSRAGVAPGPMEHQTVLAHWPELIPFLHPVFAVQKEGKDYRAVARWPRPDWIEPLPGLAEQIS